MRRVGWTLVELLVVVAIILTLMAVVWAVWQPIRDRGLQAVCASKMHQIWVALENYRQDYRGLDPPFARSPLEAGLPATIYQKRWFQASYIKKHPNGWMCPTGRPVDLYEIYSLNGVCFLPCFDRTGNLTVCRLDACSFYEWGYYAEDLLSDWPTEAIDSRAGAEIAFRCDRFLFQRLGSNYILLYDTCHRQNLDSKTHVYTLFIHFDGHFSAKTVPSFRIYQANLCEELGGGDG